MSFSQNISPIRSESLPSKQEDYKDQASISLIENPEEDEEFIERDQNLIESTRERFDMMQALMEHKMRKMGLDIEVFFHEEKLRTQEALDNNQVFNEEIPIVMNQLGEFDMSLESLEVFEKSEKLTEAFENDEFFIQQKESFQRDQEIIQESLTRLKNDFHLEAFCSNTSPSELIKQVSGLYGSRAEAMFNMLKTMGIFRFRIDDEGWLEVSPVKGKREFQEAICYEDARSVDKLDLKIDDMESTEMMTFALNFLLENCLEKISNLYLSFCGRFLSDQEAKRFNDCFVWRDRKMKLTVDFTDCTFESEETLLIFFRDKIGLLENLEGFKYFLKNTNATQKTLDDFNKLVISRMKNLERFGFDFHNLSSLTNPGFYPILFNRASALIRLSFSVQRTPFTDNEMILFSETVLPVLTSLQELELWLGYTQVTDTGLFILFNNLKEACASRLKTLILGVSGTNVTDKSLEYFGYNVLPLMENLEDFRLYAESTSLTERSMVPVLQNIKCFASKLKTFILDLEYTTMGDEVINALALSLPLMEKIEHFDIWFSGTKITDQSMINLYSSMEKFSDVWRFQLDCSETAITNESLLIFATRVLPKMTKLKKFIFYANKTKLDDSSLQPFLQNLSGAGSQLLTLKISLNGTEVGYQGIFALAFSLASMKNLQNLSLWFNQTNLADSSVKILFASFKPFARNLETLSLGLDSTRVTDQGIMKFGKEIVTEMKSLKELRFWVSKTKVGDSGLIPLFENLKGTMGNIHTLQLCLSKSLVGDQSLLALATESLPKAENFRAFELWATDTGISDLSLVPLILSLKKSISDVSKLALSYVRTKMTDWSVGMFSHEVLVNLRNLREVQFFLGQSQMNGSRMIPFFDNLASKVQNIQKFELELKHPVSNYQIREFADKVLPNLIHVQDFKIFWNVDLSYSTSKAFCLNAKKAIKNIKTFDLRPSSFCITTDTSLPSQKSLQSISFELNEMFDPTMEEIIQSFEDQVSQVKTFSLIVKGTKVSDKSIKALANTCFSFMPNLESLTLNLDKLEISDEAFCFMCRSFEQFAGNLKFFKINLDIPNLTNPSITILTECGLAKMTNLESLEVNFNSNKNLDQSLVHFFTEMQHWAPKLKSLSLNLPGPKLSIQPIEALATLVFPNLKSLTSFQIGIYETSMTDSDFVLLFSGLKGVLGNTKSFILGLSEETLTGQALDVLSLDILPQLKNVETFKCYAVNSTKMTTESLTRFNEKLQEVSSKIVTLMLRLENMGVTNEVVNEFALKTLGEMKSLKDADISFGHNAGVDDDSIVNLFDGLGGIVGRLSSLQLGLHCTGLTDVSIERFKESLAEGVGKLGKFSMNISGNQVSEENKSLINKITH